MTSDGVTPPDIVAGLARAGDGKLRLGPFDLLLRGFLSGALLGFATSLALGAAVRTGQLLVGALVFPAGFAMIVLLGLELVTGSFAVVPLAVIGGRGGASAMLGNWSRVFLGNLLGSVFHGGLLAIAYEPGDSLSVAAANDPVLVERCLAALDARGDETVPCPDGAARPLREALAAHLDIARPLDRTLDLLAMAAVHPKQAAALRRLAEGGDGAEPADADLLDLLGAFPSARPPLADLARSLPALRPRLYSIASSPRAAPGQVHLCIDVVREARRGRVRAGVASAFLADRAIAAGPILAAVQPSHFRLPADPATPVIMCGPGTGIAPLRAFLQERAARGARGRSWLFFGDRRRASDFLYSDELQGWLADGTLGRLEVAFSRDHARKVYVQDRMRDCAGDLWRWLQDGAHFHVCGGAARMARDVDAALRRIAMTEGGLDEAQAKDWIVALARQGRYLRDIH